MDDVTRVHGDPLLEPAKRRLLTDAEHSAALARLEGRERAHESDDAREIKQTKQDMMPFDYETVAMGSQWSWSVMAQCDTPLAEDTLMVMLGAFLYLPIVGGKKGTGHGVLRVLKAREVKFPAWHERAAKLLPAPSESTAIVIDQDNGTMEDVSGRRVGELFVEHVQSRAAEIKQWLAEVKA